MKYNIDQGVHKELRAFKALLELKGQLDHREFKGRQDQLAPVAVLDPLDLKVQPDREEVVDLLDLKAQLDREEVLDRKAFKGLTEALVLKEPLDLKAPQAQAVPVLKELLELKAPQAQAVPAHKVQLDHKEQQAQMAQVVPVLKELKAFKELEALKEQVGHKVLVEAAVGLQTID